LIEEHGYGTRDSMYYVKEQGKGRKGMDVIDNMYRVEKRLEQF
jgi:hypothetical protein